MSDVYVYDKAKYHQESIDEYGLPIEHTYNHTLPILRWFIENNLMSNFFNEECAQELQKYSENKISIQDIYEWWDCCLISDMVAEEGNKFGQYYFDFENGKYISDYSQELKGELPTELHVKYSEENYQKIKSIIDKRYKAWKKPKPWWLFWH